MRKEDIKSIIKVQKRRNKNAGLAINLLDLINTNSLNEENYKKEFEKFLTSENFNSALALIEETILENGKMRSYRKSSFGFLNEKMSKKIIKILDTWKIVSQSPYSYSFYNSDFIDWNYKPDKSLRISNHWNFVSEGEIHCATDCGTKNGWYVGKYNAKTKKYKLLRPVFTKKELEKEQKLADEFYAKRAKEMFGN